jgi:hypothetical protein
MLVEHLIYDKEQPLRSCMFYDLAAGFPRSLRVRTAGGGVRTVTPLSIKDTVKTRALSKRRGIELLSAVDIGS